MSALAVLLLVPNVALLPPEAPPELAPVAEACAQSVAASGELRVTRLSPAPEPSAGPAARARAGLDAAVQAYRELRLAEAKALAEQVVTTLQAEAASADDFEMLLQARLRLALTLLAQRRNGPARALLEAAARARTDATVTEADWPPNLVAAWEAARTAVGREAAVPLGVTVATSVPGVAARVWVDGRAAPGGEPVLLPPGEHVVVATAPGHALVRQVVRLPLPSAQTITLPTNAPLAEAIVVGMALEAAGGGVRVTVRRPGGGEATRQTDAAGAPRVAGECLERLAGVPRAVAASAVRTPGSEANRGAAGARRPAGNRAPGGTRPHDSGGSILGRWWFWTIVGGVVTVGFFAAVAAGRRDPGTDVHVGVQR